MNRVGRFTGYVWFYASGWVPWPVFYLLTPIDILLEQIPGYNQGMIAAYRRRIERRNRRRARIR